MSSVRGWFKPLKVIGRMCTIICTGWTDGQTTKLRLKSGHHNFFSFREEINYLPLPCSYCMLAFLIQLKRVVKVRFFIL